MKWGFGQDGRLLRVGTLGREWINLSAWKMDARDYWRFGGNWDVKF